MRDEIGEVVPADLIDTGSDAKPLLADGLVRVNGEVEVRRGQ